jgi:cysteinyl-tRNA synthetase
VRGIEDARAAIARLTRALGPEPLEREGDLHQPAVDAFTAAMDADFNTPDALAVIFDLARELNTLRTLQAVRDEPDTPPAPAPGGPNSRPAPTQADVDRHRRTLVHLLDVLGLDIVAASASASARRSDSIEPFVDLLLEVRRDLRELKQWALADQIRNRLNALGVTVEDKPGGKSNWRIER